MKGLMLLFMLFGLGITLGSDGDGSMTVTDLAPAIELPAIVQEPTVSEPEEEPVEEPVFELEEGGTYKVDIVASDILWESSKQPLYVDNWELYSLAYKDAADKVKYTLYSKSLKTKEEKSVVELTLEYDDPEVFYIHSSNAGGYIAMGAAWDGESFQYYLMSFGDDGTFLKKKSVKEMYKMSPNSYFVGTPVSDGTYIYASYQDGASGGILLFDTEFNFLKKLADSSSASVCIGKDGFAYLLDGYTCKLTAYNPDNDEFTDTLADNVYGYSLFNGMDGELLFCYDDIYSYNYRTGILTKLLSLEDFGIDSDLLYDVDIMYRDINGDIVVGYKSFNDDSYTSVEAYEARFSLE